MTAVVDSAALAAEFVRNSPFAQTLGLRLEEIESDRCTLVLPFEPTLATMGDIVHGGAVAALADTAAAVAAVFSGDSLPERGGATVDITVHFMRAARGEQLHASARVLRRGRSLCTVDVDVRAGDAAVAKAIVAYKFH